MYLIKLIISSFAVLITSWLLPGVSVGEPKYINSILIAFVLSALNAFLKPILVILTIKVTILTLGLFLIIINAFIIFLAGKFIDVFYVSGFWTAIAFSLILSIVTFILEIFGKFKIVRYKN